MILVSILGDFHSSILPISYEFKKKITKHIIVYDDAKCDVKRANRIIKGQKKFIATLPLESKYEIETFQIDEDNYTSIINCFYKIKQMSTDYRNLYLNATDGLSSIAIVLSNSFFSIEAKVITYDRYANTYNLHTKENIEKHKIINNMDISSHLILKGYVLLEKTDTKILQKRKDVIYDLTQDLIRFKEFTTILGKQSIEDIVGYKEIKALLKKIKNPDKKFIQGTVFEEYIYHLIVDNCNFDDVWMGTKVQFEEGVENEFDILMIKDNHLHTIECKLVNNLRGEHFVYKTELIMDYLDDDGKSMILSIGGDNINISKTGKKRVQFTLGDKARAYYGDIKIYQSKVFNEIKFLDDVREWFL